MKPRHFLTLLDFSPTELGQVVQRAQELKRLYRAGQIYIPLAHRTLALIFDKSSTRTRVSFEAGMTQLGGNAMFLSPNDTQLGRGEPIEDTARVISRMVDVVVIRTFDHAKVETFAKYSAVPVVNALTDLHHPCQLLADIQTWVEARGPVAGKTAAWIGDGNNVCHSWMHAARQFGFALRVATPKGYAPQADVIAESGDAVTFMHHPEAAARGADLIVTDTWASMGQEKEKLARQQAFNRFGVDQGLMRLARPNAIFMHCLPAYRGSEVTAEVIDGPQSVVWDEAENRLHAQKALLEFLLLPR